jgi:hypothetical protein
MDNINQGKTNKKFSNVLGFILFFIAVVVLFNLTNFYYEKVQKVTLRTVSDLREFGEKNSDRSFVTKQAKKVHFNKLYYTGYYFQPEDSDNLSFFDYLYYGIIDNEVYFITVELPAEETPKLEIADFEKTVIIETEEIYQLYRNNYNEILSSLAEQGIDLSNGEYQIYPYLLADNIGTSVIIVIFLFIIIMPVIIALIKLRKRNRP